MKKNDDNISKFHEWSSKQHDHKKAPILISHMEWISELRSQGYSLASICRYMNETGEMIISYRWFAESYKKLSNSKDKNEAQGTLIPKRPLITKDNDVFALKPVTDDDLWGRGKNKK